MSAVFRHSSANGERDGKNDRKEGFHGTKVLRGWLPIRVRLPGGGANRRVKLQKRSQLFIRTYNETLPVISRNSGYRHMSRRVEKHGIAVLPGWLPYSRSQIPWIPRN